MGLLGAIARPIWNLTRPLRRPLARAWHDAVRRAVAVELGDGGSGVAPALARIEATYPPAFGRIEHALRAIAQDAQVARAYAEFHGAEANALMDGMIREVARLQFLVEDLRERVDAAAETAPDLGVVGVEAGPRREVG